jgi:hypothetical protein
MSATTSAFRASRLRIALASVLALLIAGSAAASASAQPAYHLVNQHSGKVLMPAGASTAWGQNIYQRPKVASAAQQWYFTAEGGDRFSFRNRHSNLCIHPSNWSPVSGTYLLQASCTSGGDARVWSAAYANGSYVFRSVKTGLYMDVVLSSTATNANAVQASFDHSTSQHWRLEYAGDF